MAVHETPERYSGIMAAFPLVSPALGTKEASLMSACRHRRM